MAKITIRLCLWSLLLIVAGGAEAASKSVASDARYLAHGDTVYDKKSDLTWARCTVGQRWVEGQGCLGVVRTMTFATAQSQENGPWRLPTKEELQTLVDRSQLAAKRQPTIDTQVFPDMDLTKLQYWGSTSKSAAGAYVYFGTGTLNLYDLNLTRAVRLVHRGQ